LGLKGGVELSKTSLQAFVLPFLATLALAVATPFIAFFIARVLRFSNADSGALAAHYGSVSVVTFISCLAFLDAIHAEREGFLSSLLVVLEVPAIVLGLMLAKIMDRSAAQKTIDTSDETDDSLELGSSAPKANPKFKSYQRIFREILTSKSVLLLLGGLTMGWISGAHGYAKVEPFFGPPFQGVVAIFLMEMGMVAAKRFRDLKKVGIQVVVFAFFVPLIHALLGIFLAKLAGMTLGGQVALGTLAASASYIAAPAAVRIGLPKANPGVYLTASLSVTFPLNIVFGIPLYYQIANWLNH
jgi:uncharacterized protein